MLRTRFTKLGKVLVALMFLFYGAAVTSQSGLLLLLIGLLGGCFAVNWSFARRNVQQLIMTAPNDVCLVEGASMTEPWRLENHSTKHIEMIETYQRGTLLFRVPLVEVNDVVSVVPNLIYSRRGVYANSEVSITSAAPYGLLRASRTVDLKGEVIVFPRVFDAESPAGLGLDVMAGGKFRGGRRVNSGAQFAGVRTWQPGDTLKQVHWNSTARRGELMVRMFEEELGGRVTLILDCEPAEAQLMDDAVRAAASLGTATLQEGHHLEFIFAGENDPLRLAPFNDELELLYRLARYEPRKGRSTVDIGTLWRKSTLAIVGTRFRPEWLDLIEEANRQNRAVHIYLRQAIGLVETHATIWEFSEDQIFTEGRTPALPA